MHALLVIPTKSTLLNAIHNGGNLNTFSGLTAANVNMFFPESDKNQKSHMKQQHQGTRSTKIPETPNDPSTDTIIQSGIKQKDSYLRIFDATKCSMYTNKTGKFPVTSSRGNLYLMVVVEMDGNYIN